MLLTDIDVESYLRVIRLIGGRYFLIAGSAFTFAYIVLRPKIRAAKIQHKFPRYSDYVREIGYSVLTIMIFALVPLFLLKSDSIRPHTTYYTDINRYGWGYFFLAFPIMLFIHDTYFYWMHRLMHLQPFFRFAHLVHHKSTNPSPWAAYAFHPIEALIEAGILAVFLFTIPVHRLHLPFFFLFMITYNVYGHLGWELYPKGFNKHPIGKWINTSVNHNQHHQHFKGNYGLYFLFWDRLMGTLRKDYDKQYETVTEQKRRS